MRWTFWPGRRSAPPSDRSDLGRWGEDVAVRELRRRGYTIDARNVRIGRGEIDIVARDDDVTVIVEVKARTVSAFGGAREAITAAKRRQLVRLGLEYLAREGRADADWRIDVVAVDVNAHGGHRIAVLENAVTG